MLHLIKIQLALTLILKTTAEYMDVPRANCPDKVIEPCKCLHSPEENEVIVKCIYPIIRDYRSPPLQATSATPIQSLNRQAFCALFIENGHFYRFDRSVGDYIKAPIVVIRDSAIIENFDMFEAFRGMDDYLYALVLRNVATNNATFDRNVKGFRQFRIFHLEECPRSPMHSPLNKSEIITRLPETVCEIVVKTCHIEALKKWAFERYKSLRKLDLSHNYLTSVSRSNLPPSATYLLSYDISYNPITSLPDDMFVKMPALRAIRLKDTNLGTLNYYTFQPVLNHLDWLEIPNIPLTCDCEASWLTVNLKVWKKTETVLCSRPDAIRNRKLSSLEPLDLCTSCEKVILEKTTFTSKLSVTNSTTENNYSRNTDTDEENTTAINSETKKREYKGHSPFRKRTGARCSHIGFDMVCFQYCEELNMFPGFCISRRCECNAKP